MFSTTRRSIAGTLIAATGLLGLAGCGATDELASKAAEQAAERAAGEGNVDVNVDDDEASFSYDGEDGSGSFRSGGSVPEDWPDDVPLPDEYEVLSSTEIEREGGSGIALALQVPVDAESIVAFYADEFEGNGWTVSQRSNVGEVFNLVVQRDDRMVNVGAVGEDDGGGARVTINAFQRAA